MTRQHTAHDAPRSDPIRPEAAEIRTRRASKTGAALTSLLHPTAADDFGNGHFVWQRLCLRTGRSRRCVGWAEMPGSVIATIARR